MESSSMDALSLAYNAPAQPALSIRQSFAERNKLFLNKDMRKCKQYFSEEMHSNFFLIFRRRQISVRK